MNSEELELSLRTEFEGYLKSVLAEMRQEATEFQNKIEEEFEEHKTRFDKAFQAYTARFDSEHAFDEAFRGSVAEHLRLARDEGARITADAMVEAEKMDQAAAPAANYDGIRDAVNDISSKDSQSSILKSLVDHAAAFAPRGAFFIIKNEHFSGWKVFGTDGETAENAIREIHFPVSADSLPGAAVRSLATVDGSAGAHSDDAVFMEPLQFGHPDRMYAIPLVARGKGVAVLYADYGSEGTSLNREALETLVRVAALTVELLASTKTATAEHRDAAAVDLEEARHEAVEETTPEAAPQFDDTIPEVPADVVESESSEFAFSDSVSFEGGFPQETESERSFEAVPSAEDTFAAAEFADEAPQAEEPFTETVEAEVEEFAGSESSDGALVFDSGGSIEPDSFESTPFDTAAEEYEPAGASSSSGFEHAVEPVAEAAVAASPARLSDRPVDLPIEVPDDERRIHNDARRFARLLVSEIKLYNEKKVIEGREASDLYERLREAIDRSREMYDKRVQPPVAAKFDYFDYEVVNSLAEGDAERLGSSYPGSAV